MEIGEVPPEEFEGVLRRSLRMPWGTSPNCRAEADYCRREHDRPTDRPFAVFSLDVYENTTRERKRRPSES